ncbi:hypothetical protein M8C21_013944, partial [Ambrosia artemisiifolia]
MIYTKTLSSFKITDNKVKNCGYVTLIQAWIMMLDKISCPVGLVLSVIVL